jgi:hypothetical protein
MGPRLVAVAATAIALLVSPVAASASAPGNGGRPMPYRHLKDLAAERASQVGTLAAE